MAYDQFSDPNAGYGDWDEESAQDKAIARAKKALPYIIVLLIVLGGGAFAYDYFIGSIRDVTFSIKDTEGNPVSASIRVFTLDGEEMLRDSGSSTYVSELRKGKYLVNINAGGYKAINKKAITIGDSSPRPFILKKNINVKIQDVSSIFPDSLVAGQSIQSEITLKNNSNQTAEVELVFEDDMEEFGIDYVPKPFTIAGKSEGTAILTIDIPRTLDFGRSKKGKQFSGNVRIKYTTEQKPLSVTITPAPEISVQNVDFGRIDAGGVKIKKVTVRNNSRFEIKDLTLGFEITAATNNALDDVYNWIRFSSIATDPDPRTLAIPSIPANGSVTFEIRADVPLLAKTEKEISGNIILNADYFAQPIKSPLSLEVGKEFELDLEVRLSNYDPRVTFDEERGSYPDEPIIVTIKNKTNQVIRNFELLSPRNAGLCHVGWLFLDERTISQLNPRRTTGDEAQLTIYARAPSGAEDGETQACKLRYKFNNPLDDPSQPGVITKEIQRDLIITTRKR